jgi:hypothetical protein
MNKFAKLFEIDYEGNQVVVLLQSNDAGYPEIRFITQYEGMMLSMAPSFEPKDGEKDFDMDKAWALAERGFKNSELEEAIRVRNVLIKAVTEQEGEL